MLLEELHINGACRRERGDGEKQDAVEFHDVSLDPAVTSRAVVSSLRVVLVFSSVRQLRLGSQPSRSRALAIGEGRAGAGQAGGQGTAARQEAGHQPGQRRGGEGVCSSDEEGFPVGNGVHLLQEHVQEIGDIAGVHVVEQRRCGQGRIGEAFGHGVALLCGRAVPFLRRDDVARAESGVPDASPLRRGKHLHCLFGDQLGERVGVPGLWRGAFIQREAVRQPAGGRSVAQHRGAGCRDDLADPQLRGGADDRVGEAGVRGEDDVFRCAERNGDRGEVDDGVGLGFTQQAHGLARCQQIAGFLHDAGRQLIRRDGVTVHRDDVVAGLGEPGHHAATQPAGAAGDKDPAHIGSLGSKGRWPGGR